MRASPYRVRFSNNNLHSNPPSPLMVLAELYVYASRLVGVMLPNMFVMWVAFVISWLAAWLVGLFLRMFGKGRHINHPVFVRGPGDKVGDAFDPDLEANHTMDHSELESKYDTITYLLQIFVFVSVFWSSFVVLRYGGGGVVYLSMCARI
jgi:hypothetical protein